MMGGQQPAAAAQARAPGAPAPPPSAPPLPPGLAEDGEFVDVELGDQERRRPSNNEEATMETSAAMC